MKFKFIKKVEGSVGAYGIKSLKTGDEVELEGRYAEKASNNPDFEAKKPAAEKPAAE